MPEHLTKDQVVGVIPPLVTPFTEDGDIDVDAFLSELHVTTELGIKGLAVGGSTGEGQSLSPQESAELIRLARSEAPPEVPVIAGIITTHTRDAIHRGLEAKDAGANAIMVTPPIYGSCSADGLYGFYSELWQAVRLPIILYNVVLSSPLTPPLTARLSEIPGVIATKESSAGTLESLDLLLRDLSDQLAVTWAQDELMVPGYVLGAVGSISAINAVMPGQSVQAFEAVQRGDLRTAALLHRQLTSVARLFVGPNKPARVKAAINVQGRSGGYARRPFVPVSPEVEQQLRASFLDAQLPVTSAVTFSG